MIHFASVPGTLRVCHAPRGNASRHHTAETGVSRTPYRVTPVARAAAHPMHYNGGITDG